MLLQKSLQILSHLARNHGFLEDNRFFTVPRLLSTLTINLNSRSHYCMPDGTEFAETFQDAQEYLEPREKNAKKRRTMMMWKKVLDEQLKTRPIEATRKIIDRQPKIMRAIIEADGGNAVLSIVQEGLEHRILFSFVN